MLQKVLTAGAVVVTVAGCATAVKGTRTDLTIQSRPHGAVVRIDGIDTCTTPCTTRVLRRMHTVEVLAPGYGARTVYVGRAVRGDAMAAATIGNIWNGVLPGLVADFTTRSVYRLSPNPIMIDFENDPMTPVADQGSSSRS